MDKGTPIKQPDGSIVYLTVCRPDPNGDFIERWLAECAAIHEERERLNYGKKKPGRPEKRLEYLVGKSLEDQGIPVQYQVRCESGIADIVTPDAIYEIKHRLNRTNLLHAIGQINFYRQQINPSAKAFIVGYKGSQVKQIETMQVTAKSFGIEIIFWEDEQVS